MAKEELTEAKVRNRLQAKGAAWATGDGATTEFDLPRTVTSTAQVLVAVGGAIKRPAEGATAYDFKVRGLSTGYEGIANRIKLGAAPGAGVHVLTLIIG